MLRNIGPVLLEDGPCVLVDLHLSDAVPAGLLEAEIEPAYPGEQGHEPHAESFRVMVAGSYAIHTAVPPDLSEKPLRFLTGAIGMNPWYG